MSRRIATAAVLVAAALATPALAVQEIKCPPGTFEHPSPVPNPLTGGYVTWCAISWPTP